jgi:DNA gyrase inhibitor GyrI
MPPGVTLLSNWLEAKLNLSETPELTHWPVTHYVYVEKIGPFQDTAQKAWQTLHRLLPEVSSQVQGGGFFSLYKIQPQMIYRAGVAVPEKPAQLPEGLSYLEFEGGKYSKFVLTGSYTNLPQACGRVFAIVHQTAIPVDDNFYIENYVNDPKTTPEEQLITEILIPTK